MLSGRLFQSFGPTEANERSPTVTRRNGRTSSWLEVANRRRRRNGKSATWWRRSDRYRGAVLCRATASLKLMRSRARSQWKLLRVSVTWSELCRPAIDRTAVLRTDWRRFSRLVGKPANVALPKSSFISTRMTIRVWKTDDGTDRRTLRSWHKTAKQPATVRWMWDQFCLLKATLVASLAHDKFILPLLASSEIVFLCSVLALFWLYASIISSFMMMMNMMKAWHAWA